MTILDLADALAATLAAAFPALTQCVRTYAPTANLDTAGPALAVIPRSSSPRYSSRIHDHTDHELAIALFARPPSDEHAGLAAAIIRFCRANPTTLVPGAILLSTIQDPTMLPAWLDELLAFTSTAVLTFRTYEER